MGTMRLAPIALTALVSAAVLFGGWFGYQHFFVKQPLDEQAASVPGVREADVFIGRGEVRIILQLEPDVDLRDVYTTVRKIGESAAGSRDVRIEIAQSASKSLEDLWSKALFDVAEAMEHRRYGDIPARLDELAADLQGVTVTTEMDDANVYVMLSDGSSSKYVVLPRVPAVMEAWTDDSL